MLKILFIPDINGRIGRTTVAKILPQLKKKQKIDLVIANADNLAHGIGATKSTIKELMNVGVDYFTNGDHAFDKEKQNDDVFDNGLPILRPANYSASCPGKGFALINVGNETILLINLIGRVFMKQDFDCPFQKINDILSNFTKQNISAIIVDIHAEATSEKIALRHYLDGRVSAILGTHTHVMTADNHITNKGTAYISDAGMVGSDDGILGVDKENIIKTFLTQIKYQHVIPEKGKAIFNAVIMQIDPKNKKAKNIKPIIEHINIK